MNRLLYACAAALIASTGAHAQTFNGSYIGGEIGYSWSEPDLDISVEGRGTAGDSFDVNGLEGGVFTGYRRQFANNIVIGGEAAGLLSGADGGRGRVFGDFFGPFDLGVEVEKRSELSLSVRPGYVVRPDTLVYLIGGYQQARYHVDTAFAGATRSDKVDLDGYHVGLGVEHAPRPRVSVRAEYKYQNYEELVLREPGERLSFEPDESVLRLGVLFRF